MSIDWSICWEVFKGGSVICFGLFAVLVVVSCGMKIFGIGPWSLK